MDDITAVSYRDVPPDPSITEAVGTHHELPTALADLVDNAIDANARHVHIRFVTCDGTVTGVLVLDDGDGMDKATIDAAMTFARKRDYEEGALGHYGLGLKAASLSQANVLEVFSRTIGGTPVGRRISRDTPSRVETLDPGQVKDAVADRSFDIPEATVTHGTAVRWRDMRTVLTSPDDGERAAWLSELIERIRSHLGLVFNRIIASRSVIIGLDEFDLGVEEAGSCRSINALDPLASGRRGPDRVTLNGDIHGAPFELRATILTRRTLRVSEIAASARASRSAQGQGLYVYRNNRLLQIGGWGALVREDRDHEHLRISFDLDDHLIPYAQINPEKNGVVLSSDLRAAILGARSREGTSLSDLLEKGRAAAKKARSRQRRPIVLVKPTRGLSQELCDAVEGTVEFSEADPVALLWRRLENDSLVDVDINARTLWINERYRKVLGGSTHHEDAPLLKALLLIIYSKYFDGVHLGDRKKREIIAWDRILRAAIGKEVESECDTRWAERLNE